MGCLQSCFDSCLIGVLKGSPDCGEGCLCKLFFCRCCYKAYYEGRERLGYVPEKFWDPPSEGGASEDAKELVIACLKGLNTDAILDCHVHIIASGPEEKNGCYLHDNWYDMCCHPQSGGKRKAMLLYFGQDTPSVSFDDQYIERLTQCYQYFLPPDMRKKYGGPRASLLAMDEWYDEDGNVRPEKTAMYINNAWVDYMINKEPDLKKREIRQKHFHVTPSIHPYKPDACEELRYWHARGCRQIKWLPPTQGIDPASDKCRPFYKTMAELDPPMWLLTHTGNEHTLNDAQCGINDLGNPLKLRLPLEMGVNVIAAHVSGVGYFLDLDYQEKNPNTKKRVQCLKLLFRLFDDCEKGRYPGKLYADLAAFTSWSRVSLGHKCLEKETLHKNLVYGSDFPVIALNIIVWLCCLNYFHNLLPPSVSHLVREIYYYNPCLSDFVKKRCMRYRDENGIVHRFPNEIFQRGELIYSDLIEKTDPTRISEDIRAGIPENIELETRG